jgi:hypothetical protein
VEGGRTAGLPTSLSPGEARAEEEEEVCSFGFRELCRKYKLRIHDSQANRGEAGASRDGCRLLTDWRSG